MIPANTIGLLLQRAQAEFATRPDALKGVDDAKESLVAVLNAMSGYRMAMGIGSGDSQRAAAAVYDAAMVKFAGGV
jgi:hypothetical protein